MVSRGARLAFLAVATFWLSEPANAQSVLLQIKPNIGDTLRMHLSQTVEMTGYARRGSSESPRSLTTSIEVFSRAVPEQYTSTGTLMQAITDSVAMTPASAESLADLRRRALQAKNVVLRVSTDGAMELVEDADPDGELRHLFGEMPAMLSRKPVAVGEKWTREMQIPLSSEPGAVGNVRATFQLDSLAHHGELAFISMKGTIARINSPGSAPAGPGYGTSGTLSGSLQIDRRLGWITDSRSTIIVRSMITPATDRNGNAEQAPMQVRTKITQWIRAMRAR